MCVGGDCYNRIDIYQYSGSPEFSRTQRVLALLEQVLFKELLALSEESDLLGEFCLWQNFGLFALLSEFKGALSALNFQEGAKAFTLGMPAGLLSGGKAPLVTEAGLHSASRLSGERKLLSWT